MRWIAFLFLAVFGLAGVVRHSGTAAPAPAAARPLAAVGQTPVASLADPQPAPQVLRHKRRFAKAALRSIKKVEAPEPTRPQRQMAKVMKPARW
jgi:hypothetical protein